VNPIRRRPARLLLVLGCSVLAWAFIVIPIVFVVQVVR
jgi:hypothetical protein